MAAKLPTFDELLAETVKSFRDVYKVEPDVAACAPGRVNLIGEHIDYCDGCVMPMVSDVTVCLFNILNFLRAEGFTYGDDDHRA